MHASMIRKSYPLASIAYAFSACAQEAETDFVVAIAGVVPVAVRRPAVLGVVAPVAAADNAVRACYGHVPLYNIAPFSKICK